MSALKLVIVSGPYEGERLRRAAAAAGLATEVADTPDALASDPGAPPPDAVLVTTSLVAPAQAGTLEALRTRFGQQVALMVLGDPEAAAAARTSDLFFARPTGAEDLMEKIRFFLESGRGSAARPERPAGSALRPLRPDLRKTLLAGGPPERGPRAGRVLERLAASIDETLDAEMLAVARAMAESAEDGPPASQTVGDFDGPPALTRQVPRALVESMLGDSFPPAAEPPLPPTVESRRPTVKVAPVGGTAQTVVQPGGARLEGDLADADLPMLLGRAFAEAMTGRLRCQRGGVEKAIYFEGGRPVLATSNATDDRMIEIFLRQGRISPTQHAQAVKVAAETGRRMGALLVDLGIMKSGELLPAVREHYEEIIGSLFAWESGRWIFDTGAIADARRIRLLRHPAALVSAGLRRAYPLARARERIGSGRNVFVVDTRGGAVDVLAEIGVDPDERRVPLLFDGVRTFEEIIRVSGLPEEAVHRVALALWVFRLLLPVSAAPIVAAGAPRGRDLEVERERVLARFAVAREGDYFQVLGVDRQADGAEIRRVHERLERELRPDALGAQLGAELATQVGIIREVLGEAMRVLGDDSLRARYRDALAPTRPPHEASAASGPGGT
jgi:hypothetical protein